MSDERANPAQSRGRIGDWVVHKSSQLLAFNKPPALAVQTARPGQPSLQALASAYAKRDLYLVHRIDQPASGLVVFGRHQKKAGQLQRQFAEHKAGRTYLVVVDTPPDVAPGELRHHLVRDGKTNKSTVVGAATPEAKEALLTWEQIGETDRYPILRVKLATGRHHQIRAQLAAVGAPIHGDVKYGARRANADRSIHLHAYQLSLKHPVSGEVIQLRAPVPEGDALWDVVRGLV